MDTCFLGLSKIKGDGRLKAQPMAGEPGARDPDEWCRTLKMGPLSYLDPGTSRPGHMIVRGREGGINEAHGRERQGCWNELMCLHLDSPRRKPCNGDSSATGAQKTLVGKQGNETGKGRRSMISVLSSRLPAAGTCMELWKTA